MKKSILLSLALSMAAANAMAQPFYTNLDTIPGYNDRYYYSEWYTDCPDYYNGTAFYSAFWNTAVDLWSSYPEVQMEAHEEYVPHRTPVKGLVAFVAIHPRDVGTSFPYTPYEDITRINEYMRLIQTGKDSAGRDSMWYVGEVRWDTATPKIIQFPLSHYADSTHDTNRIFSCYAYEAYFDKPVFVDSTYYIAGTFYNNAEVYDSTYRTWLRQHWLTAYVDISEKSHIYGTCPRKYFRHFSRRLTDRLVGPVNQTNERRYGCFLPIVDRYVIQVGVDSGSIGRGQVHGRGKYYAYDTATVTATAAEGYRFTRWHDGVTDNPRQLIVTTDSIFTACFACDMQYTVRAEAGDTAMGSVAGGGTYYEDEVAVLTATPAEGYLFDRWDDSVADSPRSVVVTRDTVLTALFRPADTTGIPAVVSAADLFTLTPNPAQGSVVVSRAAAQAAGPATVTLLDAAGHEVLRARMSAGQTSLRLDLRTLPAGPYFVTLTTPSATATRRLITN